MSMPSGEREMVLPGQCARRFFNTPLVFLHCSLNGLLHRTLPQEANQWQQRVPSGQECLFARGCGHRY